MPVPAGSSRQDRRKAHTRARILDAAEEFFASADPASATIARIAEQADVAVATVYQHFAGKDDLHLAVVERALAQNEQHMLTVYSADLAAVPKLIDALGAYLRFYRETPQLFRLVALRQGHVTDESSAGPVAVILAERVDRMTAALAGVIEQGVAEGVLRGLAPLDTARFLWGALNGVIGLALRPDQLRLGDDELGSAIAQGAEILFGGMVTAAACGPDGRLLPEHQARLRAALQP